MVRSTPTQAIAGATLIAVVLALALLVAAGPAAAFIDEGAQPGDTEPQRADDEATTQRTTQSEGFIDTGEGAGAQSTPPSGGVDAGLGGTAADGGTGAWSAVAVALLALTVAGHVGVVGSRRRAATSPA